LVIDQFHIWDVNERKLKLRDAFDFFTLINIYN